MKFSFKEIKRKVYLFAAVLFVLIAGLVYIMKNTGGHSGDNSIVIAESTDDPETTVNDVQDEQQQSADNKVVVYVCGAVVSPGVYELDHEDRISDAIDAAGGFKKNAANDQLNLAGHVSDGEKIVVYTKKQLKKMSKDRYTVESSDEPIVGERTDGRTDINTATEEDLMKLPGIGESKAKAIVSYREENGPFKDISELMNISGIKEGVMSRIRDFITAE